MNQKIVLTGGPAGGKTTIAMALARTFSEQVAMIPESASLLFTGGFRRVKYPSGVMSQQRAIYQVQKSHEEIFRHDFPGRLLICDRGTVDGKAYWPAGAGDFYSALGTTEGAELGRYDWVLSLDTANGEKYDRTTNPHRQEQALEAIALNHKVKQAWCRHPRLLVIPHTETFLTKMSIAMYIIDSILNGQSYEAISLGVKKRCHPVNTNG